tara:strand:- start:976 stop:1299 length:324 start_codon:yes stop_codon:yes gene_type:complete
MIEGMKRTILIPILLATFLLVGCESEFDRCFEANGGNDEESIPQGAMLDDLNLEQKMLLLGCLEIKSRQDPRALETNNRQYQVNCLLELKSRNKNRATRICHARGIY